MKGKNIFLAAIGVFTTILLSIALIRFSSPRNYWSCEDGEWVKYGNPKEEMPQYVCGDYDLGQAITNFEECVAAGNPVLESYPRKCDTPNESFLENIGNELEMMSQIIVYYPRPNNVIEESFVVTGEARGTWFYEGTLPIKLIAEDETVLYDDLIITDVYWMTEDFVPFEIPIQFEKGDYTKGNLIIERDIPSVESGLDSEFLEIPVTFK